MLQTVVEGQPDVAKADFQKRIRGITIEIELLGAPEVFQSYRAYAQAMAKSLHLAISEMKSAQHAPSGPDPVVIFQQALSEKTAKERAAVVVAMRKDLDVS